MSDLCSRGAVVPRHFGPMAIVFVWIIAGSVPVSRIAGRLHLSESGVVIHPIRGMDVSGTTADSDCSCRCRDITGIALLADRRLFDALPLADLTGQSVFIFPDLPMGTLFHPWPLPPGFTCTRVDERCFFPGI